MGMGFLKWCILFSYSSYHFVFHLFLIIWGLSALQCVFEEWRTNINLFLFKPIWTSRALITCLLIVNSPTLKSPWYAVMIIALYKTVRYGCGGSNIFATLFTKRCNKLFLIGSFVAILSEFCLPALVIELTRTLSSLMLSPMLNNIAFIAET